MSIKEREQEQGLDGWVISGSFPSYLLYRLSLPRKDGDLASFGQALYDLGFVICVMDTCFTELSRVAVLLPVVVPVPPAVCPKPEYIHLDQNRKQVKSNRLQMFCSSNKSIRACI